MSPVIPDDCMMCVGINEVDECVHLPGLEGESLKLQTVLCPKQHINRGNMIDAHIADKIEYPEKWDEDRYPTLASALYELLCRY